MKKKIFAALSLILSAVLLLTACGGGSSEPETEVKETTAYIASDGGFVNVYGFDETADEDSEPLFGINFYINRGTEVTELDRYYEEHFKDENDEPYTIKYTEIRTADGQTGYVLPENLVQDKSLVMQETEKYVRTPVTVYENADTPDIAGYIPKGSRVELTGFRNVDSEGVIDMYKVSYEGLEGYVYGKYLAVDSVSADTVYYQDGIYDIHKDRTFRYDLWGGEAKDLDYFPYERPELSHPMLKEAKAMYLNCEAAVNNSGYLEIAEEYGTNAFVIDIKDERLAYESNVAKELCPTAYHWAYTSMDTYKKAVQEIKAAGIYTIGRIVVFSDDDYADDHPEDCIESVYSGGQWPSAFDRDVWEYNVKLAVEAVEELGFDEIQLDYVRFPESSWQMSENDPDVDFKNQYGEEKAQAVQGFIFYAADKIHEAGAYLSVDVFGECAGEYVTAYGQYWPAISNIADAISGMPYTDHYGETDTWSYPYNIVATFASMAAERQKEIPTPAIVRTWITGYDTPNWDPVVTYDEEKLVDQITALYDYGLDGGFIPWHGASNINKYWQYAGIWSRDYKSGTAGGAAVTPDEAQEEEQTEADEQ